jgi:A/G-specific adenine glycosylase
VDGQRLHGKRNSRKKAQKTQKVFESSQPVGRASPRAFVKNLYPNCGSSVASPYQIAVRANSKLKIQNSKLQKLVPLLLNWFAANARDLPWRRTRDPYAIWVSEIMLQQTQVKTVIPYWNRWLRELPTIKSAANASVDKIHKLWEGLGYYTRVRNLQKAAQFIMAQHNGGFPQNFDDVLALPGIGRYTAGAICSIAFNQPTPILDGNVIRVLARIFSIGGNPKEKETNARLWRLAEELVSIAGGARLRRAVTSNLGSTESRPTDEQNCSFLNQSLMELGALVCTPRNPQCRICPAKKLCVAFRENRVEQLPNPGKRATATARRFAAFIVESKGRFLVRQRPAGVVNAHLWEFPNVEVPGTKPDAAAAFQKLFGVKPKAIQPLRTVKHSITRYRITLEAHLVSLTKPLVKASGHWLESAQFDSIAFTAAHRKILTKLPDKNVVAPSVPGN